MPTRLHMLLLTAALPLVACGDFSDDDAAAAAVNSLADELVTAAPPPADYVATPNGYYHRSCVHAVGDNATVDVSGRVSLADGGSYALPPCAHPRLAFADTTNGWVEQASFSTAVPATSMTSSFTVPAAPTSKGGQTIFFFPGMEPSDGTIILQPVLQWGASAAGGSASWTLASWSCGPSCVHSSLIAVKTGDTISGKITGSKCSTKGQCEWQIASQDTNTGQSSTINTRGDTKSYTWLFAGALEAYSLTACAQYPAGHRETFSNVKFYDVGGKQLAASYKNNVYDKKPSCGFSVTSTSTGATLNY